MRNGVNLAPQTDFVKLFMVQICQVNAVFEILLGLGANLSSNVGSPLQTLQAAIEAMPAMGITPGRCSSFYQTAAIAPDAQPPYVNAVISVETAHSAADLLAQLHALEALFGRTRKQRWGSRSLDIDLLDYRGEVVPLTGERAWGPAGGPGPRPLTLPHPMMAKRAFVLVPLAEIAPSWRHPVTGESAQTLLERLEAPEKQGVVQLNI